MHDEFLDRLSSSFPDFASKLGDGSKFMLEHVLPPASDEQLIAIECQIDVPLPASYKELLECARGFWLMGGVVQFSSGHPFFHDFPSIDELPPQQRRSVERRGGIWPPPSQGMLCIAEFFMDADGDQILFDVSQELVDGEYPVMYYSHESSPPSVRQLSKSFSQFLAEFLDYPEFEQE